MPRNSAIVPPRLASVPYGERRRVRAAHLADYGDAPSLRIESLMGSLEVGASQQLRVDRHNHR